LSSLAVLRSRWALFRIGAILVTRRIPKHGIGAVLSQEQRACPGYRSRGGVFEHFPDPAFCQLPRLRGVKLKELALDVGLQSGPVVNFVGAQVIYPALKIVAR